MAKFTKEERREIYLRLSEQTSEPIVGEPKGLFTCWKLWREIDGDKWCETFNKGAKVAKEFPEYVQVLVEYKSYRDYEFLSPNERKGALLKAAELCKETVSSN